MALSISGRPVPANIPKAGAVKISRLERTDSAGTSVVALAETIGRSMQQISAPFWDYSFSVPPGQVNHEGYGVTLNEINRPYLTPLVDVTSGKSLRASFSLANFRIAIVVPCFAQGGITAHILDPSGKRASSMGSFSVSVFPTN